MTGKETAQALTKFVNCFTVDEKEFVDTLLREHRTLQQGVFSLFLKLVDEWAKQENFDLRNEFTIEQCKKIKKMFDEQGFVMKAPMI